VAGTPWKVVEDATIDQYWQKLPMGVVEKPTMTADVNFWHQVILEKI
jgi:hypothetical protein